MAMQWFSIWKEEEEEEEEKYVSIVVNRKFEEIVRTDLLLKDMYLAWMVWAFIAVVAAAFFLWKLIGVIELW